MALDISDATKYIDDLDLRGTPRGLMHQDLAAETGAVFDKAKDQAQVVGSGVFSFVKGVTPAVRTAISDSALLAQLVANKRVKVEEDPLGWFREYAGVLQSVGWVMQDGAWNDYSHDGTSAEVHEKIVEIMTVVLGPGAAALAIITATVGALKAMKPESSWITIFERETRKAKMARFQIGLVEPAEDGDVFVTLLACLIEAKTSLTQVLVFKFKQDKASFKAMSQKVSINQGALTELGPKIAQKVRAYQFDYLSSITDI